MSQVKLTADTGGGTTSIKGPAQTTGNADVVFKLPIADGSSGEVLKTDGSGQLSFTSNAGTTINNNADNRVITGSGTASTLEGEANLTFDGTILEISNATPKLKLTDSDATGTPEAMVDGSGGDLILHVDKDNEKGSSLFAVEIDGSEKIRIDSSGHVGIGVTPADSFSFGKALDIGSTSGGFYYARDTDAGSNAIGGIGYSGTDLYISNKAAGNIRFLCNTDATERMRIDSSGRVGINSTSPTEQLEINLGTDKIVQFTGGIGQIGNVAGMFAVNTAKSEIADFGIMGNTLKFASGTALGGAERMRITSNGHIVVGSTSADSNNSDGIRLFNFGSVHATRTNEYAYVARRSSSNGGIVLFRRDSTDVGNISVTTSATSYNSGSDYRLKQDDKPLIDGLTRLKQLKPIQFKWKNDTSKFVDGFFAHEVSPVVPESITGEKDAVYEEDDDLGHKKGDPIYQQIDQAKLVPLLTAALQEEVAKREALEARVAALETA